MEWKYFYMQKAWIVYRNIVQDIVHTDYTPIKKPIILPKANIPYLQIVAVFQTNMSFTIYASSSQKGAFVKPSIQF